MRLGNCARDIRILRILVERSFQLFQSAIPLALPAVHCSDKLERLRVIRLKLDRTLEFS